jgi:hypothetical protein
MSDDTQRSLGRLEAVQETHDGRLTRIEQKLDHVVSVLDGAKGGWKTLVTAGAVASAITAAIIKVYEALFSR